MLISVQMCMYGYFIGFSELGLGSGENYWCTFLMKSQGWSYFIRIYQLCIFLFVYHFQSTSDWGKVQLYVLPTQHFFTNQKMGLGLKVGFEFG